jgi:nicotinic acid mononucleotide adenylyltransferase
VEELNRLYPDDRFFFIFGEDCLDTLESWREPERILAGAQIIAATRGAASDPEKMKEKASSLMEKLGGGGHMSVAGAQLENVTAEDAVDMIKSTLDNMVEEGEV